MRYKNATAENLSKDVLDVFKKATEENKGVFFFGNTGVGKTYALHALANDKRIKVDNFILLLSEFRDYMQRGFYFGKLSEYCEQDYVLIDDIGGEKISDFVIEFLYSVINKRYENMKRTILATNLSLMEIKQRYGDRILSRLGEMCVIHEIKGEDRRLN